MNELSRTGASLATDAELIELLEASLGRQRGQSVRIAQLDRQPFVYYSSYPLETLTLTLAAGERLDVLFKDLSPPARLAAALEAKPAFRYDPGREIACYTRVLAADEVGPPRCYGSLVDPSRERYWLFLEHLAATRLNKIGELSVWQAAARWLAAFHNRRRARAAGLRGAGLLLDYDAAYFRYWLPRALAFQADSGDDQWQSLLARLANRYDEVVQRLVAVPPTLIHGEFYPSNVLVADTTGGPAIHPIDWETAGLGPGALDLAALTAGEWQEDERLSIVDCYWSELEPAPGWSRQAFLDVLESCRLHLAVQALGWSESWTTPEETANDWLAEAARAAAWLGL